MFGVVWRAGGGRPKEHISNGLSEISPSACIAGERVMLCRREGRGGRERRKKRERKKSGEIWFSHGGTGMSLGGNVRPSVCQASAMRCIKVEQEKNPL